MLLKSAPVIVCVAVPSAFQFAGVIHWISLVILSVFFSEVGQDWDPASLGQLLSRGGRALLWKHLLEAGPLLALEATKREMQYRELSAMLRNGTAANPTGETGPQWVAPEWNPRGWAGAV